MNPAALFSCLLLCPIAFGNPATQSEGADAYFFDQPLDLG